MHLLAFSRALNRMSQSSSAEDLEDYQKQKLVHQKQAKKMQRSTFDLWFIRVFSNSMFQFYKRKDFKAEDKLFG